MKCAGKLLNIIFLKFCRYYWTSLWHVLNIDLIIQKSNPVHLFVLESFKVKFMIIHYVWLSIRLNMLLYCNLKLSEQKNSYSIFLAQFYLEMLPLNLVWQDQACGNNFRNKYSYIFDEHKIRVWNIEGRKIRKNFHDSTIQQIFNYIDSFLGLSKAVL